ncbi:MAG: twin-arginine translocation signal domain-containing protein, partial [Desulfovibrio sp.]|nr:twin-arginine translocation signal domain-containing protein [Desulfovibrio sp.]
MCSAKIRSCQDCSSRCFAIPVPMVVQGFSDKEIPMQSTRRSFLKGVGAGVLCLSLSQLGFDLTEAKAYAKELKIK